MSFQDEMFEILPPKDGSSPNITSDFRVPRSEGTTPHVGIDFNYKGGAGNPLNAGRPEVDAPVSGTVTQEIGSIGSVTITDAKGYKHTIMHLSSRSVSVKDYVERGQKIGTMGHTGASANHVHYQIELTKQQASQFPANQLNVYPSARHGTLYYLNPKYYWGDGAGAAAGGPMQLPGATSGGVDPTPPPPDPPELRGGLY